MTKIKKGFYFLLFFISYHSLFCNQIDKLFNNNYNFIKINKNNECKNLNYSGDAILINENYLIFLEKDLDKSYTSNIIFYDINNKAKKIINKIEYSDEQNVLFNENGRKVLYSISQQKKNDIRYIIDLKSNKINKFVSEGIYLNNDEIRYWKDDNIKNWLKPWWDNNETCYVNININRNTNNYLVEVLKMYEITIDEIPYNNELNYLKNKTIALASYDYGFYTKPIFFDIKNNVYHLSLNSCDTKDNIREIKLINIKKTEIFDISLLENSSQNYEYLIVFGKHYKKEEYKDVVNFMALVRKKDLALKYYPILNNDLKNIDLKFGQYLVKDNKIILANSQEDKSFITLVFQKDKTKNATSYFTPTINNLRFRASPSLQGKFIRSLKKGEKLELLEKGKTETIGDVTGTWVKVKTNSGEVGWCFDAYLEEVK
ncbi:MAG: SH3 domain-containing protein [Spirochaetes bacterium]|nr:SH3 domain-containing protein [Spirochaetota bacterium]